MALEESGRAVGANNVSTGEEDSCPPTAVFGKFGVLGLKEDFYAVEGGDGGFCYAACYATGKARAEDVVP